MVFAAAGCDVGMLIRSAQLAKWFHLADTAAAKLPSVFSSRLRG